ncbi:uncharacterized protein LOC132263149 [Phlebotomus argentipes]|uniref:uncharacterized protein LOC132263149 n=1 Tax=Phlebotomus argentipes TaxID=94469 RepID=UPI002892B6D3|nr:uncharacterized protein LOC132263149 [Phlebotomus argentipes]
MHAWAVLCVALLGLSSVLADGQINTPGNSTKLTKTSDDKTVYMEGGSFQEKLPVQKSVKKELGEPPRANTTVSTPVLNVTLPANATSEAPKVLNSTTTTTSTTVKTTASTTTTPRPKKPSLTVSVQDDPSLLEVPAKSQHPQSGGRLDVEEPVAQLSQENILELPVNHRDYIVPIVVLIFAIPMILGLATVVVRRFRDYWLTRHYRRMDYLVDGMYNE